MSRTWLLALLLLATPVAVSAQSYAIEGTDHYFRIEWEASQGRRGPVVAGYVHNKYGHTADRVRLLVEGLDAAGQVASSRHAQIVGPIPPGSRSYFEVPATPGAASYRLRVLSFDPIGRGV